MARSRIVHRSVSVVILLVLACGGWTPRPAQEVTAQTEADAAAEFAYGLSGLEHDGNYDQLYNLMHPDAKAIIPRSAVVGWYREDFGPQQPHEISQILAVRQVAWTWPVTGTTYPTTYEVDFVQPFGTGAAYHEVTDTVRLVPTGNSFGWFFGRSREFVDAQIARFPGWIETPTPPPAQRTSGSTRTIAAGCTLVELYPGYPGYRGNVTGVLPQWNGLGDYECLEALTTNTPSFDRGREDRANQQAATALGIDGPPELWTWENWQQIEAQRGMTPHCYSCLMLDPSAQPIRTDVQNTANDPRVLTGFLGTIRAIDALSDVVGATGAYEHRLTAQYFRGDDYAFRGMAYITGGPAQNASELYATMLTLMRSANTPGGAGPAGLPSAQQLFNYVIWQAGGYTVVPDTAALEDQVSMMVYGLGMVGTVMTTADAYMRELYREIESWQAAGATVPLDTYLQQQSTWQAFR